VRARASGGCSAGCLWSNQALRFARHWERSSIRLRQGPHPAPRPQPSLLRAGVSGTRLERGTTKEEYSFCARTVAHCGSIKAGWRVKRVRARGPGGRAARRAAGLSECLKIGDLVVRALRPSRPAVRGSKIGIRATGDSACVRGSARRAETEDSPSSAEYPCTGRALRLPAWCTPGLRRQVGPWSSVAALPAPRPGALRA
jgi:hypothetical protein